MGRRGHAHCGAASRPAQLCQVCARRRRGGSRARGGTPPWGSSRRAGGRPPAERPGMAEPLRRTLSKLRGRRSPRGAAAGGAHRHGGGCGPQGKSPSAAGRRGPRCRVWRRSALTCGAVRGARGRSPSEGGEEGREALAWRFSEKVVAKRVSRRSELRAAPRGRWRRSVPRLPGPCTRGRRAAGTAGNEKGAPGRTGRLCRAGRCGERNAPGFGSAFFARVCEDFAFVSSKSSVVLQIPT